MRPSDLTTEQVEHLQRATYIYLLVMPTALLHVYQKAVDRAGSDRAARHAVSETCLGMLWGLPNAALAHEPVLQRLAASQKYRREIIEKAVTGSLKPLGIVPEGVIEQLDRQTGLELGTLISKELPGALRTALDEIQHRLSAVFPDDDERVHAYTDGSCIGNPGPGGVGVVWVTDKGNDGTELSEPVGNKVTNSFVELMAVKMALTQFPGFIPPDFNRPPPMTIYTDSEYVVNVLQKRWKAKANKELVQELRVLVDEWDVQIVKVAGHAKLWGNERADELARRAARSYEE